MRFLIPIAWTLSLARFSAAQTAFEWIPVPPWGPPGEMAAMSGDGSVLFDIHRTGPNLTLWRWDSTDWSPFIVLPECLSGQIVAVTDSGDGFVANVIKTDGSRVVCRYRSCCGLEWMTAGGMCSANAASRDLGTVIGSSNLGAFFWDNTEHFLPGDVLLTTVSGNGAVAFGRGDLMICGGECPCATTIKYSIDGGLVDLNRLTTNYVTCGGTTRWDMPIGASWTGDTYVVNRMSYDPIPEEMLIWRLDAGWTASHDIPAFPDHSAALAVSDSGTVYGLAAFPGGLSVFSLDQESNLSISDAIEPFVGGIMQDSGLYDPGTMSATGRYAASCVRHGGYTALLWHTHDWGLEDAVAAVHHWYTQQTWGACYSSHRFSRDGSTVIAWFNLGVDQVLARIRFDSRVADNFCDADFDRSGFVDTDDFDAFVGAFEVGDPAADRDGTCFVDTDDFDAFVLAFEAGC